MIESIKCCDCDAFIDKKNVLRNTFGDDEGYDDIVCGNCIKNQYGEKSYNFWANLMRPK